MNMLYRLHETLPHPSPAYLPLFITSLFPQVLPGAFPSLTHPPTLFLKTLMLNTCLAFSYDSSSVIQTSFHCSFLSQIFSDGYSEGASLLLWSLHFMMELACYLLMYALTTIRCKAGD